MNTMASGYHKPLYREDDNGSDSPYRRQAFCAGYDGGLDQYLREIAKTPLLSAKEETRLGRRARKGDSNATNKLVVHNLRLVVSIAKKYMYYGTSLLDLIEEGNLGLMKAADKYDPERGCKFSTYATWWIRQAVTRALSNQARTVRVPVYVTDEVARCRNASDLYWIQNGKNPSDDEVAETLNSKVSKVREITALGHSVDPDSYIPIDGLPIHDDDQYAHQGYDNGYTEAMKETDISVVVDRLLNSLAPREQGILRHRWGLEDGVSHTLEDTGKKFHLTRERIRQLERDCLRNMRSHAEEHLAEDIHALLLV